MDTKLAILEAEFFLTFLFLSIKYKDRLPSSAELKSINTDKVPYFEPEKNKTTPMIKRIKLI